jgi:WD40 repeat protein
VAAFSPGGRICLTADHDGCVRLWDVETHQPIGQAVRYAGRVSGARFSPDGRRVVLAGTDERVVVYDVPPSSRVGPSMDAGAPVLDAGFGSEGRKILAVTLAEIREWNAAGGSAVVWTRADGDRLSAITQAAVGADGRMVFLRAIGNKEHRVWGPPRFGRSGAKFPVGPFPAAALFSPDGNVLVTLHQAGEGEFGARRWDVTGDAPRPVADWGRTTLGQPTCGAFSADGQRILVGCRDGAIVLDEGSGRPISDKLGTTSPITAVAFRADGAGVLGSQDGTIRLWNPSEPAASGPAIQASGAITSLAFSSDGGILLAGCNDGIARFWNVASGLPFGPPLKHRRAVKVVRFSPDGRTGLTGGADGLVLRWRVPDPPAQVPVADLAATVRHLTRMELGPDGVPRKMDDERVPPSTHTE